MAVQSKGSVKGEEMDLAAQETTAPPFLQLWMLIEG